MSDVSERQSGLGDIARAVIDANLYRQMAAGRGLPGEMSACLDKQAVSATAEVMR
jgi:hypothetical protein